MLRFASKVCVLAYLRHMQVRRLCGNDRSLTLGIKWARYTVSCRLEIKKKKTRQKATLLLLTSIYDKRDDFNFNITNFPFPRSNIPSLPAYSVFISQLIRYTRTSSSCNCFIQRATQITNKLLELRYIKGCLKSLLRKFYGRYVDLIKQYVIPLSRMLHDILKLDQIQWHPPSIRLLHQFMKFLPNLSFYRISIRQLQLVWHANRGRLLLRTLGPVPFGTCMCSTC